MNTVIDDPILTIHIAIIGELPEDSKKAASMELKLKSIVTSAEKTVKNFANSDYGFVSGTVKIRFVSSTELISEGLLLRLKELYPESQTVGMSISASNTDFGFSEAAIVEGTNKERDCVESWLADQSDFAIVCSGERIYEHFVSECQSADIPTVVLSAAQGGSSAWTEKSFFDSYNEDKLSAYLFKLFPDKKTIDAEKDAERNVFGYRLFWGGMYKKYFKKYKIKEDKQLPQDTLINENQEIEVFDDKQDTVRRFLIKKFNMHDEVAIKYSDKYRSSIYLRAVIPLITTIALAIGFYSETLFVMFKIQVFTYNLWSIIAGLGFFTHAMLNLYVFRLSESKVIKAWHKGFIDNRFIAESLRIVAHFIPFGVPVNFNKSLSSFGNKVKKDSQVLRRLRCILRSTPPSAITFRPDIARQCVHYLRELVDEQIDYHKRTANRLVNICNSLERGGKIVFYLGFGFVLLRGCLQLFLVFNGVTNQDTSWIKSFANMLALVIPTWAGYFSLKLGLCSFKTLYNNNVSITEELTLVKQTIFDISNKNEISYEDLRMVCNKTVSTMLGEISEWYGQIDTQKVSRL